MPSNNTVIDIRFNLQTQQAYRDLDRAMQGLQQRASRTSVSLSGIGTGARETGNMFNALSNSITHSVQKMAEWTLAGTALFGTIHALQDMTDVIYGLDDAMRQVRGVTGMNKGDTDVLIGQYQKMADTLNTTTSSLSDMSLELYRQGLASEETARRMSSITKIAGVESLDVKDVTEYVTASLNAYKNTGLTVEEFGDKTVKAAAISATSVDEISKGLQKSSAAASAAKISFSTLVSWISTVSETTRESGQVVGWQNSPFNQQWLKQTA